MDKYVIHPSNTVKILGIYITNKLTHDTEIGKLSANLHNRIHNLNKMREYTTFKMWLQFMNAFVIGKLRYMLPIYMNTTSDNVTKLQRVLMRCARTTIGNTVAEWILWQFWANVTG